jgi:hypothetical protein
MRMPEAALQKIAPSSPISVTDSFRLASNLSFPNVAPGLQANFCASGLGQSAVMYPAP